VVHFPVAVLLTAFVSHLSPSKSPLYPVVALALTGIISIVIDRYLVQPVDAWRQRRALATGYQHEPAPVIALALSTAIPRQTSQGIRKSN
jgi:peptidoglycan/LPS O-acetylase OafA/YrhL